MFLFFLRNKGDTRRSITSNAYLWAIRIIFFFLLRRFLNRRINPSVVAPPPLQGYTSPSMWQLTRCCRATIIPPKLEFHALPNRTAVLSGQSVLISELHVNFIWSTRTHTYARWCTIQYNKLVRGSQLKTDLGKLICMRPFRRAGVGLVNA